MKWITDRAFAGIEPADVFHRERAAHGVKNDTERQNSHILFRKRFRLETLPRKAVAAVSADDRYKLYINGIFVSEGPAPSYHDSYGCDDVDVTPYLREGDNVIAAHTYYQGLINRVWQSGDRRHGFLFSLSADGKTAVESDGTFLTHRHTGYSSPGATGYDTQFLETYDSRSPETGFEMPDFDDSGWESAAVNANDDHIIKKRRDRALCFETFTPPAVRIGNGKCFVDLGGAYVGYLNVRASGSPGEKVTVRCGHELNPDGSVRYRMRANVTYEETWILSGGDDRLVWFDYKSMRYAEIIPENGARITGLSFTARHQPFTLRAGINGVYGDDAQVRRVFDLCVRTQKYGVQELPMDCMERERGPISGTDAIHPCATTC